MRKEITSSTILAVILLAGTGLFFWQAGFFSNDITELKEEIQQLESENKSLTKKVEERECSEIYFRKNIELREDLETIADEYLDYRVTLCKEWECNEEIRQVCGTVTPWIEVKL